MNITEFVCFKKKVKREAVFKAFAEKRSLRE